jgi:membrane protein YqaA with SNARE-associated domain
MVRRLYDWVLKWADTPYGTPALAVLSFAESSFFPVPPDVLLMALALSRPKRAFYYAGVCAVASVLGGMLGYFLGWKFMEVIGLPILDLYGATDKFEYIQALYQQYDAWAVGIAGFTPIPYKVFTIAAGAALINFPVFVLASIVGRSGRFFLVAALFYFYGPNVKSLIDKYFNILSIAFVVLLVAGFFVIRLFF